MKPVFLTILLAGILAQAQEWPRFRGPNGDGISNSTGVPTDFGPAKNLLWKTAVPFARSSPVIAGNRIFLTASEKDKFITMALDRASGRILWRKELVRPRATAIFKANDPASPTPATDGKNVYAFFMDFGLIAYTVEGKEAWRVPLGPFETFYGLAASPLVSGNTVIQLCDSKTKAFLLAVDAATGLVRWRVERPQIHAEGYSTPIVYEPVGEPAQILILGPHEVSTYALGSGERLWWRRGVGGFVVAGLVIAHDQAIGAVFGSDSEGSGMPSFDEELKKLDKNGDGKISPEEARADQEIGEQFGFFDMNGDGIIDRADWQAVLELFKGDFGLIALKLGGHGDRTSTGYAWNDRKAYNTMITPLVYRDVLYMMKNGGILASFDPASGKQLKMDRVKTSTGELLDDGFASPVAADGKLYFTTASCKIAVLKAGAQWELLGVNDLAVTDGECNATPAIAGGKIYIRTHGALMAFGATK